MQRPALPFRNLSCPHVTCIPLFPFIQQGCLAIRASHAFKSYHHFSWVILFRVTFL